MAKEQFNPSTQRVLFNPDTKKVLMVEAYCDECTALGFDTPATIKVTLAGILSCEGVSCCPGTQQLKAFTDHGIGWDGEFILEQGRIDWTGEGEPYWGKTATETPCWWGVINWNDYGGYDLYNLGECKGGIDKHVNFIACVVKVHVSIQNRVHIQVWLVGWTEANGYSDGVETIQSFFHIEDVGEESCFPYNTVFNNDHVCTGQANECIGEGTAVITEWPPP